MSLTLIQVTDEGLEQGTQQASSNDQLNTLLLDDVAMASLERSAAGCRNTGIHHVGLYAKDPAASAEFYRDVLGMEIVGGSKPGEPFGATAFLSSRPDEESHEVALFANRAVAHVAFKVSSLAELRSLHARVAERKIEVKFVVDHGVSYAFYFADPDDNLIEVYWPTGVRGGLRQPYMVPLDLTQPDEVLLRNIAPNPAEAVAGVKDPNRSARLSPQSQVQYVPAGTGRSYKSPIDQITFLLTGEQTGGAFFMAEVIVPPGCGNPPHIHDREEETFYLQQGSLTVHVGDQTLNASPGDLVQLPRGIAHCFQNNGDVDAKFLVISAPAGLEKFFEEAFYSAADWPDTMPPMSEAFIAKLLTAAAGNGIRFLPPA
jgi:catechol-2,3-dioxygenase/quercetin dioxygenase-like cupin family protein